MTFPLGIIAASRVLVSGAPETPVKTALLRQAAPTSNITQDITLSGFGTPQLGIFASNPRTAIGLGAGDARMVFGFTDTIDVGEAVSVTHEHNISGADSWKRHTATNLMRHLTSSGSVESNARWNANITNGMRIDWANAPPLAYLYSALMLNGYGNVAVGNIAAGGSIASLGFDPNFVLLVSVNRAADGNSSNHAYFSIGATRAGSPALHACFGWFADHNVIPTAIASVIRNDCTIAVIDQAGQRYLQTVGFQAGGFTLANTGTPDSNAAMAYIAMKLEPGNAIPGIFNTPTSPGQTPITGWGLKPKALIVVATDLVTENSINQLGLGAGFGISFITEAAGIKTTGLIARDNISTSIDAQFAGDTLLIYNHEQTKLGEAGFNGFTNDGWLLNWTAAPASSRKCMAIAFG